MSRPRSSSSPFFAPENDPLPSADVERFRLRRFVDELNRVGELQTIEAPLDLIDIAGYLDGNPKAVLFRNVRSCTMDIVGNVMSSRQRPARGTPMR